MSKYLKLFETTSQYEAYMGGGEKILPNVSLIEETNKVEYNPYIPPRNDIIIYTASEKLNKTWSDETVTFVKLLQFWKADLPILVTLSGIAILVKLLQPLKAPFPILVTLFGIVILVKLVQPRKA